MTKPIHIDGSHGEGGGQILRTSLALASLLRQSVKIDNIRANRKQPGLKTQHLAGVMALARIAEAEVSGAHKNSTSLVFAPHTLNGGSYRFEISTAGASSMLLGAVLPPLLFAPEPSEIIITGGTHVPFSPPYHYLQRIFLPILQELGGNVDTELLRWGFYPKGGGEIRVQVKPCRGGLRGARLDKKGKLQSLQLTACSANLPEHIVQREIAQAEMKLAEHNDKLKAKELFCQAFSPGNFIFLEALYEHSIAGFSALGRRGRPAEEVAAEVCRAFKDFDKTAATVDRHLADQIILYMALAHGDSYFITEEVTSHFLTNIAIIKRFLPVHINHDSKSGEVSVTGVGLQAGRK